MRRSAALSALFLAAGCRGGTGDGPDAVAALNLGPAFDSRKHLICGAEHAFFGTIASTEAYAAPSGPLAGFIWSTVTFDVQRNIRGGHYSSFVLDIAGGDANGETTEVSDGPTPKVGLTYLLFIDIQTAEMPAPPDHYPRVGQPRLQAFVPVRSQAPLPTAESLATELARYCAV